VRGFEEYEVRNDKGLQASAELYSQDFFANHQASGLSARAMVFYDAGKVWRNAPLPGEQSSEDIASVGLGMRIGIGQYASLKLDYAKVLDGANETQAGSEQLHALFVLVY
jgi:hemolysin activation/secretion protein